MDVRTFTVGPIQENCYIFHKQGGESAVIVDPGEEPDRLLAAADSLGVKLEAVLLTHTHFDHIGAVVPIAEATGAPVYCPEGELFILADPMKFVPPGLGPYEGYEADFALKGGERLQLAGLEIDVIPTPGHSPAHVTYSVPEAQAIFSGDVLFQGSVGRTDLPGADWSILFDSLRRLVSELPPQTTVYPGHMGATTLERELASNPFLAELRGSQSG